RELIELDNASKTATVAAPHLHVMGGLFRLDGGSVEFFLTGEQLQSRSYIEDVAINYQLSYTEPVILESGDSWSTPQVGLLEFDDPAYPTNGVAFSEDANRTTMAEARESVGDISADSSGQTVAVVDTGANTADGRVFGNGSVGSPIRISNASKNVMTNETVADAGWDAIEDGNGHGTWTAASIAANASGTVHDGVAPDSQLLVVKALADDGGGSTANIADAIRYAADQDADVISLSLGAKLRSEPVVDAVTYAQDAGSVVVVAAGNSRQTRSPGVATPADVAGVITVGATNGSGPQEAWSAYFSQYAGSQAADGNVTNAEPIDVVAPGMQIVARTPTTGGSLTNTSLSGTSMATPIVAGGIAQAMAANDTVSSFSDGDSLAEASPAEVHDAVTNSASPAPHLATAEAGHGMFNATNLASGTHPETSQSEAMTDPAQQRQTYYEAAAEAAGGFLARVASAAGG
ncbi:S8 family serine peptidase, partial [Halolamina sp. R1-12]